jgi:hypothetical protein
VGELTIGLVDATEDDVSVVREESMRVEDRLDHSSDGFDRHGFRMGVLVPLQHMTLCDGRSAEML